MAKILTGYESNGNKVYESSDEEVKILTIALQESAGSAAFEEFEDVFENLLKFFEEIA
jgi:hypothetical protein